MKSILSEIWILSFSIESNFYIVAQIPPAMIVKDVSIMKIHWETAEKNDFSLVIPAIVCTVLTYCHNLRNGVKCSFFMFLLIVPLQCNN